MSSKNLAKTISVLEDGKLSIFLNSGSEVYVQPPIVVDTLDSIDELVVRGEDKKNAQVDTTVSEIDGVAFAGTFEDLETALRELAKKANGLFSGGSSGGGGLPVGASTEDKQDVQIDQLDEVLAKQDIQISLEEKVVEQLAQRTSIFYFDLNSNSGFPAWAGFPVTIKEFQWNDGTFFPANSYPITPTEVNDTSELASLWNANVPDNKLEARDATTLFIKEGSAPVPTDNNGLIQFTTDVPAFGLFQYIKIVSWTKEPDAENSSVNIIEDKVALLADGGESLISTEFQVSTYTALNTAIVLVPSEEKRENVFLQCHSDSLWVRLKTASTNPNNREGYLIKAGGEINISTLPNGQKYTGEISLINAVDGEQPTYSLSILNRP